MIRYIVRHAETGRWMLSFYADGSRNETPECTNFYVDDVVVVQVNPDLVTIESGGSISHLEKTTT